LWETSQHGGSMQGWTDNYIRVSAPYDAERVNTVERVTLTPEVIVAD